MLVEVARTADIPEGESRDFEVAGRPVAIVNLGAAGFRAVGDICSHEHYFLHLGEVDADDETIECPKHGSTFDLNTGEALTLPATRPVPWYRVKVEGETIQIEMED